MNANAPHCGALAFEAPVLNGVATTTGRYTGNGGMTDDACGSSTRRASNAS